MSPALVAFSMRPPATTPVANLPALAPYCTNLLPSYSLLAHLPTPANAPSAVPTGPPPKEPIAAVVAISPTKEGTDEPSACAD